MDLFSNDSKTDLVSSQFFEGQSCLRRMFAFHEQINVSVRRWTVQVGDCLCQRRIPAPGQQLFNRGLCEETQGLLDQQAVTSLADAFGGGIDRCKGFLHIHRAAQL